MRAGSRCTCCAACRLKSLRPTQLLLRTRPLSGGGFSFGGLRSRSNAIFIDGASNNDEFTGSNRTEISLEDVQECERMNILCREMRRSLRELDLGLSGELQMSERMEELKRVFGLEDEELNLNLGPLGNLI